MKEQVNEKQKDLLVFFILGAVAVVLCSASFYAGRRYERNHRDLGQLDQLTAQYTEAERIAGEYITELERNNSNYIERIRELEGSLDTAIKSNRDARYLAEQALAGVERTASDIQQAISISRGLTQALRKVANILSNSNTD